MFDLLIKNGTCLLPEGAVKTHIGVKAGKISEISPKLKAEAKRTIDASGLHVLPGIIDSQVHFRDPGLTHKEDLETGSAAAALGGVTTFLEMPNTNPSTTTIEAINEKIQIAKDKSCVNYGFFIGATGENLEELKKAQGMEGCPGVKIFLGSSTGSLLLYEKTKLLEIFKTIKSPISIHSENEEMLKQRVSIRDEAQSAHAHPEWRSVETALSSTKRVIEIAKEAKKKLHILHITTKDEIEFLGENKEYCTVEVTPQHLTLFAPDCYDKLGTYAQMNPPIRTHDHLEGLWNGIEKGVVDVIGSDHAPHAIEEKEKGYPHSPSGMPGVQTLVPLLLERVINKKITLEKFVSLCSTRPAEIFNLKSKGRIQTGNDADFTLIDMNAQTLIKNEDMASKCSWTPFHDMKTSGKVTHTLVMGEIVMENGQLTGIKSGRPISPEIQ